MSLCLNKRISIFTLLLVCASLLAVLPARAPAEAVHKVILGVTEQVGIAELGVEMQGKLDTGAVSSSLSAWDIEHFTRDGDKWVRFHFGEPDNPAELELPVAQTVRIVRRAADYDEEEEKGYTRRPVVMLTLCIGSRKAKTRVNLADRRNFSTALLVGMESLVDLRAIIDPALELSAGRPDCTADNDADAGN